MRSAFRVVDVENGRLDRAHVCSRILPADGWLEFQGCLRLVNVVL